MTDELRNESRVAVVQFDVFGRVVDVAEAFTLKGRTYWQIERDAQRILAPIWKEQAHIATIVFAFEAIGGQYRMGVVSATRHKKLEDMSR